ncbi:FtsX-like permease family protein [Nocardioides terrae]|uniref:FtsX-like permease family protein n=1 Tax=Nocardioides terrae TaxID=574651 RepID=A0A1I1K9G8_9ACTN|nr:ABC transporter permease [Nocardioides terrae]SFC57587.1 FtsX-like permease family protein [Nocardioides terrae]
MLALVCRRALVQWRVLAAAVVLVAVAASLLGVCTLLLSVTQERAFHVEILRSQPRDVDVTAYVVDVAGPDVAHARRQADGVVTGLLAPMRPTVTSAVTARMRRLGDGDRLAYLASGDALTRAAELMSGRWPTDDPTGPPEAVVPDTAARLLGLRPGDRVTLGQEVGLGGTDRPVSVRVVGTFRPRDRAGWQGDPLSGEGFDATYSDGSLTAPAYGPFLVSDATLSSTDSSVTGMRVTAHPRLSLADAPSLRTAVDSLDHADGLLTSQLTGEARITRVASDLPETLDRIHAQQATTRSTVLVLLVLSTTLSLAAALLAGWLLASLRDEERALLISFGLSRRQQIVAALVEAVVVAAVAAVLAVPAASLVHARLSRLASLRAAGLTQSPTVTGGLVLTVVAGALVLALTLVVTVQDSQTATDRHPRGRSVVRAGSGVLLVALAVVGWWQLHTQPSSTDARGDVTLTVAPVLCLAAATVMAVRLVPLLLSGSARAGGASRGLLVPLAAQQAARRPHVGTAMVLIAAAVATAVFGLALRSTWGRSQEDQTALRVGTDLSLALPAPAVPQDAMAVAAAVAASGAASGAATTAASPVVDTPLALGSFLGDPGSPPALVALDTRHAGALLRGRLEPGRSWASVGADLAPDAAVEGLPLPEAGAGIEATGRAPDHSSITASVTAVVQDPSGFRSSVVAATLPLDGRPHPVDWRGQIGAGARLVAVRLDLDGDPGTVPDSGAGNVATGEVSVTLDIPGATAGSDPAWRLLSLQRDSPVRGATVSVESRTGGVALTATTGIDLEYFTFTGASVLATAFAPPADVPVAVSQDLVDAVGTKVGGTLAATVGDAAVPLRVVAVVPDVPSAPGRVAVLADIDTLTRSLIDAGRLDPVVDAWWFARPAPDLVRVLRGTHLGEVTTRQQVAAQMSHGPLRVTVPTALAVLVVAAGLMFLAGVGLVLSADAQRRSADVARLRALGLTRRGARRVLLVEHAVFIVPLMLVGALVGILGAVVVGPQLIRSDVGAAPVPSAVVALPWAAETLLGGGLLVAALVVTAVLTARQVSRSGPADLRAGDL